VIDPNSRQVIAAPKFRDWRQAQEFADDVRRLQGGGRQTSDPDNLVTPVRDLQPVGKQY
jgi:hypothetical protein